MLPVQPPAASATNNRGKVGLQPWGRGRPLPSLNFEGTGISLLWGQPAKRPPTSLCRVDSFCGGHSAWACTLSSRSATSRLSGQR